MSCLHRVSRGDQDKYCRQCGQPISTSGSSTFIESKLWSLQPYHMVKKRSAKLRRFKSTPTVGETEEVKSQQLMLRRLERVQRVNSRLAGNSGAVTKPDVPIDGSYLDNVGSIANMHPSAPQTVTAPQVEALAFNRRYGEQDEDGNSSKGRAWFWGLSDADTRLTRLTNKPMFWGDQVAI